MKYTIKWKELPSETSPTIEDLLGITGQVTGVAITALPSGHQRMTGLQTAQWSGYGGNIPVASNVSGMGEIALTRIDGNLSKSYVYPIGKSGEQLFIGQEFKSFPAHHADVNNPAPAGLVFGNIQWPSTNAPTIGSGIAPAFSGCSPSSN